MGYKKKKKKLVLAGTHLELRNRLKKNKCLLLRHALFSLVLAATKDNVKDLNITLDHNRYLTFSEVTRIIYCKFVAKYAGDVYCVLCTKWRDAIQIFPK
jgi:hypothetical protein